MLDMQNLIILLTLSTFFVQPAMSFDFSTSGKKRTCTSVDLRGPKLGAVRNQGSLGWCFAYTTADLLSHRLGQKISATELGINFYQQMPEMPKSDLLSLASGGSDMGAMSYARNDYCSERELPASNFNIPKECLRSNQDFDTYGIIKFIEKLHDKKPANLSSCETQIISALFINVEKSFLESTMLDKHLSSFEKIIQLKEKNCSGKKTRSEKKLAMRSGMRSGSESLIDIDEQLNKANPISLNYNAYFLIKNSSPKDIANHYSSIVGRRLSSNNTCQYLIRNSWGTNCNLYPEPYNRQCEEGNIWVDEDILGKAIIGVQFLR